MSQTVYFDRFLQPTSGAKYKANIRGDLMPERMTSIDWFDQTALDTTNGYTVTVDGTSDAVAVCGGGKNGVKFTTGTGDNEVCYFAGPLVFDISTNPAIESKVEITDVSGTIMFFGFSDAVTEATPNSTIDADSGTFAATATDAVGFLADADKGSSSLYLVSVKTGGAVQYVDTGIDWADAAKYILRIRLDSSGNAWGYVDGVPKAYIASAVADVPLCAIWNAGTRANDGSNYVYARYLAKWQDIP